MHGAPTTDDTSLTARGALTLAFALVLGFAFALALPYHYLHVAPA